MGPSTDEDKANDEDKQRIKAARLACDRFLNWHGHRTPAEQLATIPDGIEADRYGEGGVVTELEQEVASLLGKPAALFLPSGTMAQQAVLRVYAERSGRRSVVFHPACHLEWGEGRGYQRLHQLLAIPAGELRAPLTRAGLEAIAERPAALLIELPQRDLGGVLPSWEDLEAQVEWARDRDGAVHMDGARLWEAAAGYGRPPAEVAALFDTVYVSLYKGLGGISGCCLAGPEDVVAEVSEWRTRAGGRLFALWPYAAAALSALRTRLPRMPAYLEQARAIATALSGLEGVTVLPDPPHTSMMHLQLTLTKEQLQAGALRIAEADKVWTFDRPFAVDTPHLLRIELSVGDATMLFPPAEVRDLMARLIDSGE